MCCRFESVSSQTLESNDEVSAKGHEQSLFQAEGSKMATSFRCAELPEDREADLNEMLRCHSALLLCYAMKGRCESSSGLGPG